jgi:hypothetical protein
MENPSTPPPKKGLGPLAWVGIGCGSLIVIGVIVMVVFGAMFGSKLQEFGEEAQKNPTRAAASVAVKFSGGQLELVAEDDVNKRYTLKDKKSGELTTIYWDAQKNAAVTIKGDFSAIPGARPDAVKALEDTKTAPPR